MKFTMSVETKNFNRHIRDFISRSNISAVKIIKKFAFDLIKKIVIGWPVDIRKGHGGRSRAAWFVGLEKLGTGGAEGISTVGVNQQEVSEGKAKGRYSEMLLGPNKWIEIVNGVDYALFLEYGHSKQAPFGRVRLAMREMRNAKLPQTFKRQAREDWNKFRL